MKRALILVVLGALASSCGAGSRELADVLGEIQGELCNPHGQPVAGARVLIDGRATKTDADGHFRAFGMAPGRASIVIGDARHVDVFVPERDIAVIFDDACRTSARDAPPFASLGVVPNA